MIVYTNAETTLFKLTDGKYKRIFIPRVFWDETKQANTVKSGMTVTDRVSLVIPYDSVGELELAEGKDFFFKGEIALDVDNSSEKTQAESLKLLRNLYGAPLTVVSFDKKLFGSKEMWHYEVSLK